VLSGFARSGNGPPPRTPWSEFLLRASSALLALAAWGILAAGLFRGEVDDQAVGELEAGGRFAINIALYLPYLAVSAVVVVATVLSLLPRLRTNVPVVALVATVVAFSLWTLGFQDLYGARPQLPAYTQAAVELALMACLPVALGAALPHLRRVAPPDRDDV